MRLGAGRSVTVTREQSRKQTDTETTEPEHRILPQLLHLYLGTLAAGVRIKLTSAPPNERHCTLPLPTAKRQPFTSSAVLVVLVFGAQGGLFSRMANAARAGNFGVDAVPSWLRGAADVAAGGAPHSFDECVVFCGAVRRRTTRSTISARTRTSTHTHTV